MSRSLNLPNNSNSNSDALSMIRSSIGCCEDEKRRIRRKVLRRKMNKSASDNAQLSGIDNFENLFTRLVKQHKEASNETPLNSCNYNMKKQIHQLFQYPKQASNSTFQFNSSQYCNIKHQRRSSIESSHSSSSANTIHETGDAHYEWDDYRVCICFV